MRSRMVSDAFADVEDNLVTLSARPFWAREWQGFCHSARVWNGEGRHHRIECSGR